MATTERLPDLSTDTLRAVRTLPDEAVPLHRETLLVNPSGHPLVLDTDVPATVPPMTSVLLNRVTVRHSEPLLLFTGWDEKAQPDLGRREGWTRVGDDHTTAAGAGDGAPFPPHTPLWRSPITQLGFVTLPPGLLGATSAARTPASLRLQANLWFAPAGTDCHIHRRHPFLEVHTQVAGHGRMQKFHAQDEATRYQDVPVEPGTTHPPFCAYDGAGTWRYPWHRYWADTDCVWLALEYHPR
ncbi:hypothetical protein [Streptomyces carpaticus]|uniref:Cupin domain-containing protein n=1 Tax=Streptomyces carpaticus TaxID=285558 RepID=A0ABV4ZTX0_9ACTN